MEAKLLNRWLEKRCRDWVREALGTNILMDKKERALRMLEEATELAQAAGISPVQAAAVAQRVYSRPAGNVQQESAGLLFTLLVLAWVNGIDLEEELESELSRVEDPALIAHIREKHLTKVAAGIGLPFEREEP